MTGQDFLDNIRCMESEHLPDGYPAIKMCEVSRLIRMVERLTTQIAEGDREFIRVESLMLRYRAALDAIKKATCPWQLSNIIAREALEEK